MTTGTRTVPTVNPGASPREQYEIKALKPVAGVTLDQLYYVWGFTFFICTMGITIGNNYLLLLV